MFVQAAIIDLITLRYNLGDSFIMMWWPLIPHGPCLANTTLRGTPGPIPAPHPWRANGLPKSSFWAQPGEWSEHVYV